MLFKFAVDHSSGVVQEMSVGLELNETRRLLTQADDVNLLGNETGTIMKPLELNGC
jgi:hypothetical protein